MCPRGYGQAEPILPDDLKVIYSCLGKLSAHGQRFTVESEVSPDFGGGKVAMGNDIIARVERIDMKFAELDRRTLIGIFIESGSLPFDEAASISFLAAPSKELSSRGTALR